MDLAVTMQPHDGVSIMRRAASRRQCREEEEEEEKESYIMPQSRKVKGQSTNMAASHGTKTSAASDASTRKMWKKVHMK